MYHDGEASRKSEVTSIAWKRRLDKNVPLFVNRVAEQNGIQVKPEYLSMGSYNCCYKVKAKGFHTVFRFPILGKSAFRYEKSNDEFAAMAYISRHTSIPTPEIIAIESSDLGPFIIMSFVEGTLLSDHLQASSDPKATTILNPDINIRVLTKAYNSMAGILIRLSKCQFTHIGGVVRAESNDWHVAKRPVTVNMNQLVSFGNYPPNAFPPRDSVFSTANDYFAALAEAHVIHLETQRNDAIDDEADCRRKYVARRLFLRIARRFSTAYNHGPFPLYCDDLRPTNVIVGPDLDARGVIDWEYCYAAPAEMTYCSPWWLLLIHPEDWKGNLDSFLEQYLPRHELFLQVLRNHENQMIQQGDLSESQRLSTGMAQSLHNGHFWFCLAATSSFRFDDIYWKFIDQVHYGEFTSIEDRIALLSHKELENLEPFIRLKVQQAEERKLDEHCTFHEMFIA
ncbi:putative phosphotransferase enzyme family protein [Phaeomoniella chlamydospora]|uniref:Putative phosphotransferase enzyme family protein n=1 Tax=Phaeomoniella chlamydospora TaxID=158046 RepID=A0A0G2GSG5_PHACM|nr:putative phosphotransferase enzyme family protein [Phaeomoniella chlamydospora]